MKQIKIASSHKKIFINLIIFIFLPTNVYSLDLSKAITSALKNDPEYLSALESLKSTKEVLTQSRAPLLPNISGSISNS